MVCHRGGDDRSRADQGVLPDGHAAENRRIRPNAGTTANPGGETHPTGIATPRPPVVGQCGVRADKDIIFNGEAVPHRHVILNRDAVTNHRATLDVTVLTDVAIPTYHRAGHKMRERPNPCTGTHIVAFHDSGRMDEDVMRSLSSRSHIALSSSRYPANGDTSPQDMPTTSTIALR